jgi:hypothetical protein
MKPEDLHIRLLDATESRAVVEFAGVDAAPVKSLRASIFGPACIWARTLPSEFSNGDGRAEVAIQEPCYWTPELPFLYELTVTWRDAVGAEQHLRRKIGLRQLEIRKSNLYWGGKRVVLRGVRVNELTAQTFHAARAAEMAVIATNPLQEYCDFADLHGVALIADLRPSGATIETVLRLTNHSSVAIVLLDRLQADASLVECVSKELILAISVGVHDEPGVVDSAPPAWARLIAVDLKPDSRPPSRLAKGGKPVIAIREGESYADFQRARTACDRLQATLAPEFDFAGYFV